MKHSDQAKRSRPTWVDIGGLMVGVASVIVAIVALGGGSKGNSSVSTRGTANDSAGLSLVDLYVRDSERGPGQPRPHVEITLHNLGARRVIIDRARIKIRRVYELRRCASQDDLPLSHTYGVALPVTARPGFTVEHRLHQQIGPDEADRFAISLSADTAGVRTGSLYLFELGIALRDDAPRATLPVGRIQISLPELPVPGEYYWTDETSTLVGGLATTSPGYVRELRTYSMPCWRSNTATLHKAFESPAVRSGQLESISGELVAPSFAALE